jgi:hypothetical protein
MPESKIDLPAFLLADLYKDNLVVFDAATAEVVVEKMPERAQKPAKTEAPVQQPVAPVQKWFLGEHKKQVVVIVKDEEAVFLEDESLAQLTNMLAACKLTLADVAIVNVFKTPKHYNEIHEALQGKQYILFGINTSDIDLPFAFPFYQLQNFNNSTFVSAPPLSLLKANTVTAKTEKSKLWLCLKKMFNV